MQTYKVIFANNRPIHAERVDTPCTHDTKRVSTAANKVEIEWLIVRCDNSFSPLVLAAKLANIIIRTTC